MVPGQPRQQSWVFNKRTSWYQGSPDSRAGCLIRGRHGTRTVLTAELGVSERTSWYQDSPDSRAGC